MMNLSIAARVIVARLKNHGGMPLIVGGAVRDYVMGIEPKDVDIEVYGMSVEEIVNALAPFNPKIAGATFGVVKVTLQCQELDVSVPRRDNKIGKGHNGFAVDVDPSMTPMEAAARRDYTMNALAFDPYSEIVLDYFGGQRDIEHRWLRATSPAFTEDPLRVLRGMQFAGRFDMMVEPYQTKTMCRDMVNQHDELATERIWEEWKKWALKSKRPSAGLLVLRQTNWVANYDSLCDLIVLQQDAEWHPEGDVWAHTSQVVDAAAQIAVRDNLDDDDRLALMLGALCHDMGKATTTALVNGRWVSPGHDEAGVRPARIFLSKIGCPEAIGERAVAMTRFHMAHLSMPEPTPAAVRRLACKLDTAGSSITDWLRIVEADHSGRKPLPGGLPETAKRIGEIAAEQAVLSGKPKALVLGRHICGPYSIKPGPEVGRITRAAYEAQLDGKFSDEAGAMRWLAEYIQ